MAALPRDDRWDSLARGAMRDDLYSVLDGLTRAVLESTDAQEGAEERVQAWMRANEASLARTKKALSGLDEIEEPTLAPLSVALRALRSIVRAGGVAN